MIRAFGKLPTGRRKERILKSLHYREGSFHNIYETQMLTKDATYPKMIANYFKKIPGREPASLLPSVRSDLKSIPATYPVIIWFGHSSYLISIDGKNILVDPVFSEYASPIELLGKKGYSVENPYTVDDLPDIDLLIITHDHYDHLDYPTIMKIKNRVNQYCTALGVGEHLVSWGVDENAIVELDWWEQKVFSYGLEVTATPARHFSGRTFTRNQALWNSFVLKSNTHNLFIGGDSGYDGTFKVIGEKYGPFDFAVLECGQYNTMWPYIHMMPEEAPQACIDLHAKAFLPVHWGKFTLAMHSWKDPIERAVKKSEELQVEITTPRIGEMIVLDHPLPRERWWEGIA
jgi:L-ascorbate metabolism protein UlaG (beta-lactamase superfamily)